MANNPLNLALRFLLELLALFSLGYWGWTQHSGAARFLLGIGLPLAAATVWGVFRVPGHHGPTPVIVPGPVRLLIEAVYFGGAVWALFAAGRSSWGTAFAAAVIIHYILSYDYVRDLL